MSRILLLCAELGSVGGVERLIATLAPILSQEHEVQVASFDPAGTLPGVPLSVPFYPVGKERSRSALLRPLTYLSQVRRLRRLERTLKIDVTISNLWRADLISALVGGHPRRIALAHINIVGNHTNRLMLRFRPLVAYVYRRFDRIVAVSSALGRELTDLYRLDPSKVRTIWNPVVKLKPVSSPSRFQRIVWCGRMVREKNVPALVKAFAAVRLRFPDAVLDLVGDGPERSAIEATAALHDLKIGQRGSNASVIFHGRLADPAPVISEASVLALPSIAEGFGLVLVEALGLGIPVVAADCASGGVHEVLGARTPHDPLRCKNEELACGWLLPVPLDDDSVRCWATTLEMMLSDTRPQTLWRDGALARAEEFIPKRIGVQWATLLADVIR